MLKMTVKGVKNLRRDLGVETRRQKKALDVALKVEGFRLLRQLRADIRAGKPGGRPYAAELSKIAGRTKTGRLRKNQAPLYRIARMLRYDVVYTAGAGLKFSFGFLTKARRPIPGGYKDLLLKHQEGVDVLYKGSRRDLGRRMARIGAKLKKKGDPDARYFFLRRTTARKIDLPRRPVINPFWRDQKSRAMANIRRNFRLKLAGRRI